MPGPLGSPGALAAVGCAPTIDESWTCDFDASESRPLSDPDASPGEAGVD